MYFLQASSGNTGTPTPAVKAIDLLLSNYHEEYCIFYTAKNALFWTVCPASRSLRSVHLCYSGHGRKKWYVLMHDL